MTLEIKLNGNSFQYLLDINCCNSIVCAHYYFQLLSNGQVQYVGKHKYSNGFGLVCGKHKYSNKPWCYWEWIEAISSSKEKIAKMDLTNQMHTYQTNINHHISVNQTDQWLIGYHNICIIMCYIKQMLIIIKKGPSFYGSHIAKL